MPTLRRLLSLALPTGLFALAFVGTLALRTRPWSLTVPYVSDPAAETEDLLLMNEAMARLPDRAKGTGPDVVVIVLDTVRADHLELYGYPRSTMPRLTAWAEEGRVWTRALSTSAWTLPAHASLFTGLLPIVHSADGAPVEEDEEGKPKQGRKSLHRFRETPLSARAVTVAERLRDAGWRTVGVAANKAFLQTYWNLDQGFDLWLCEDLPDGADDLPYTRGDRITSLALATVDRLRADEPDQPLFLFFNYMEAHGPYVPRDGYVADPDALTWRYRSGSSRGRLAKQVLLDKRDLPETVRAAWTEAYDAELRFLDEQLDRLLTGLAARGIGPDDWVVIVSDHGEYFGEHSLLAHSKDVYQPVLQIPLIVRGPGVEPGRTVERVQLDDVAHMVVRWAGVEPLPDGARPDGLEVAELYGSRVTDIRSPKMRKRMNRIRRAFVDSDHKIILGSDGTFEAYDLHADPAESRNLAGVPWSTDLKDRAEAWLAATPERPWASTTHPTGRLLDFSVAERLRALGYQD